MLKQKTLRPYKVAVKDIKNSQVVFQGPPLCVRQKMLTNASQQHGIDFENQIHLALHGTPKEEYERLIEGGYTAVFDIVKGIKDIDFNGSIKVTGGNGVACGDIVRMYNHTSGDDATPYTLIVGRYTQVTKTIKEYHIIYEFYIKPEHHSILWGSMQLNTIEEFVNYVKNIPHGKEAQLENKKLWKDKRQHIYENEGSGLMTINAKIDSRSQRRTQASLNIKFLKESDIPFKKYTQEYRGFVLPYIQENAPKRKLNKK